MALSPSTSTRPARDSGDARPSAQASALLRSLPSVEEVLHTAAARRWLDRLPRPRVADTVREAIAGIRAEVLAGSRRTSAGLSEDLSLRIQTSVERLSRRSLRAVINASGVVLHTNLGRAPLSSGAVQAIAETAGRYSNLEYNVSTGRRGSRDEHCGTLLQALLGAPAIVVNNNAAAIFLALNELAMAGEAVVSRGELIEIGDGFRIPEILAASGATVREVGTTNRTRLDDYRQAITARTKALVRVHPSNFQQVGFTGRPALEELVALARSKHIPLVEDLGSGCISGYEGTGIEREPTVSDSLSSGVDVVTFSADKLLGGPQAGVIAGRPEIVKRIRRNPIFRALRVDKLVIAALSSTLRSYIAGRHDELPALRFARESRNDLGTRVRRFVDRLETERFRGAWVADGESVLGGGTTPMQALPSPVVSIRPPAGLTVDRIHASLRGNDPPVVARIEKGNLVLDLRTVFETEEDDLVAAVLAATVTGLE